jgi:hypothetical protein
MKLKLALAIAVCLLPGISAAGGWNLTTLSCAKYEKEVLSSTNSSQNADPINTVMWLLGFSVAKSGDHVMYGDALTSFGFALDSECKNNPDTSLLDAVKHVKLKHDNPMDLVTLKCAAFESRHTELTHSDPESANTLMMWLFGYSVGRSGADVFDASSLPYFESSLQTHCTAHPGDSLFDALAAVKAVKPAK